MKNYFFLSVVILFSLFQSVNANEPDSAYVFAYATTKNAGHNGLHFAWSIDRESWHAVGPEHRFVGCDYGQWGAQKRMLTPYLYQAPDGMFHCVWSLNEQESAFAHVASEDLIYWARQSYPLMIEGKNCLLPEIIYDKNNARYLISWQSQDGNYYTSTKDFIVYSNAQKLNAPLGILSREEVWISGNKELGTVNKVPWTVIDGLLKTQQLSAYRSKLYAEKTSEDPVRFASLSPVEVSMIPESGKSKKISDMLIGIFFEDINYAADGGLYAELIQNRDFEYDIADTKGRDKNWNSMKAWTVLGQASFAVETTVPAHPNNPHYAVLQVSNPGNDGLSNEGFDGIAVKAGDKYDFAVYARMIEGKGGKMIVRITNESGSVIAETSVSGIGKEWKNYRAVMTAKETAANAKLEIFPQVTGSVALDMISLFPQKTFKGRKNGMREDLALVLADMHPRFVRFPGGCLAHGDGIDNIYRWETTVGPLIERKPQRNIWNYHQTVGLGYYEYFQFCEDIGAEPLPVIAAGVPCQNSGHHGCPLGGQQGGIPMDEMDEYIRSILNLIEWANGDAKSPWGKVRAEAGHPKPFNLKFIGIGNEDLISDVFEERFTMIFNAVKAKYPEITIIGTVGPFSEGTDYVEGWKIADKLNIPMVDEHYYQPPGWYIHNQDYYDKYDRSKSKVYLGEYAAHLPGRPNNIETALAEALHITTLERNGDVVSLSSYAPLLAKEKRTQWNPNLIYFNNTEVKTTVGYYVQMLCGQNSGDIYFPAQIKNTSDREDVKKRFAASIVQDSKSGDLILKMVNLLPVSNKVSIDLKDFNLTGTDAAKIVLQGKPDDRKAKPVASTIAISDVLTEELPAYSFTVIRIKTK